MSDSNYLMFSIKTDESYKTIEDYEYPEYILTSFLTNYSRDEKKDLNNGRYFNKIGFNKNIMTPSGCYDIPYYYSRAAEGHKLVRSLFYKYCAHHLFYGKMQEYKTGKTDNFINFAQYLPNVSPLCLDFDIVADFEKSDRDKFKKGDSIHIYTDDHIYKIVEILNNIIFDNFDIEIEDIKAYVFEKETFRFKKFNVVKDGIHIIYLLPFNVAQRFFIRNELINKLKDIKFIESFNFNITNSYEDIVDEAVISRNPWLTYGSVKVESKTRKDSNGNTVYYIRDGKKKKKLDAIRGTSYDLTHIFDYDLLDENVELIYDENTNKIIPRIKTYETIDEIEALFNLFDLDQFSDDDPLDVKTEKAEEFIEHFEISNNKKKHKNNIHKSNNYNNQSDYNNQNNAERINYVHNLDTKTLFKMVEILKKDEKLYNIYPIWFKICCSLYASAKHCNIPEEDIKNALIDFSKGWNSFNISHFEEEDYPKIIKTSTKKDYDYSLLTPMDYIKEIDFEKYNKLKRIIYCKKSKKNNNNENDLKKFYSFNNYKKNNNFLNIKNKKYLYF